MDAFRQGLADFGYVEGKTVAVDWRSADGKSERLRILADALVGLKVAVIKVVAGGGTGGPCGKTSDKKYSYCHD